MTEYHRISSGIKRFARVVMFSLMMVIFLHISYEGLDSEAVWAGESKYVMSEVKKAIKEMKIKKSDSDYEKVKKAHDWLVYNFEYDLLFWNYYSDNYSDYTEEMLKEVKTHAPWKLDWAFEHRQANCSGYSNIFKLFMDSLGIECKYISSKKMNHAWNMVLMDDGCWYHIDVTWDDSGYEETELGAYRTLYFLRNDKSFPGHSNWDKAAPKADGEYYENNVNHNINICRDSRDKYWKNGNLKVSYGDIPNGTDCIIKYNKNGGFTSRKYTDTKSGAKITETYYTNGNKKTAKYVYDDSGDVFTFNYYSNGNEKTAKYVYGESGNVTTFSYYSNGIKKNAKYSYPETGTKYVYDFNKKGEMIKKHITFSDGRVYIYEGLMDKDRMIGIGKNQMFSKDGSLEISYTGEFNGFKWNGKGEALCYYEDGTQKYSYEGDFVDYLRTGSAVYKSYNPDGSLNLSYTGEFNNFKFDGEGIYTYYENGKAVKTLEGTFSDGKFISGKSTYYDEFGNAKN